MEGFGIVRIAVVGGIEQYRFLSFETPISRDSVCRVETCFREFFVLGERFELT